MYSKPISLFVPRFGTIMRLSKDWTFSLYHESRNDGLLEAFGLKQDIVTERHKTPPPETVTLPKGTVLKVDRIYIRRDCEGKASDYDSITFQIKDCPKPGISKKTCFGNKTRFWAKMDDCNFIIAEIDDERKVNTPQPSKGATGEIKAGDLVKIDYASAKLKGHWITRDSSKKIHLVIGITKDGTALLFNVSARTIYDRELYTWYKDGVYVIQGHEDDIRGRMLTWANKTKGTTSSRWLTKSPEDFVDQFIHLPQVTEQQRWQFTPY